VLYHFTYREDKGVAPNAALIDLKGLLYGTNSYGGKAFGTVYSITTTGTVKVLYDFDFADGSAPYASLIKVHGTLYGTTLQGGAYRSCVSGSHSMGCGTVFSLTTGGTEDVLHSFGDGGSDGWYPWASLVNVNGTLYGTTIYGGTFAGGTVYAITP
jgi:uncharacterized repeat protein (TIGR03803 family)